MTEVTFRPTSVSENREFWERVGGACHNGHPCYSLLARSSLNLRVSVPLNEIR
jgi:hypothetical protein